MDERENIKDAEGVLPIKEAAQRLGIAPRTLYEHVQKGRIQAIRFANVLAIPESELQKLQYGISGRPRQNTPTWRISASNDVYTWLHIFVALREGSEKEFARKIEAIRKSGAHTFPGTAARYISRSDQRPGEVQIQLIWRGSMIPTEKAREEALEALRRELADVLLWETARYETGQVIMHT